MGNIKKLNNQNIKNYKSHFEWYIYLYSKYKTISKQQYREFSSSSPVYDKINSLLEYVNDKKNK